MVDEREGHHFEYSERAKQLLQPEERLHRGKIGSKKMDYAPSAIAHKRDMDENSFEKIGMAIELQKLNDLLEVEGILITKVKALKALQIEGSLGLICKNMGLNIEQFIEEFVSNNPLKKGGNVDLDKFRSFILKKVEDHIANLKNRKESLEEIIDDVDEVLQQGAYVARGISPDHSEVLPYVTESGRGLNPEAMLQKMRELTEPDAPEFHLHSKNCSKTSIAVLSAGAAHDPLLKRVLGEEALASIGTPQQVKRNVQKAKTVLMTDRQDTLFTKIANSDRLNQIMGRYITQYTTGKLTKGQKAKAITAIVAIGILKAPETILIALLNPLETISYMAHATSKVFNYANSLAFKAAVGLVSMILLTAIVPFALIEYSFLLITAPLKALFQWVNEKPASPLLADQIDRPLPSKSKEIKPQNSTYYSLKAKLVNDRIASKIGKNTVEVQPKNNSPIEILNQFEKDLRAYPEKVITLSPHDFDKLRQYVDRKEISELIVRFQKCCNESLKRANKLSPHTPTQVDEIANMDVPKSRAFK